jgi:hypothetical protein
MAKSDRVINRAVRVEVPREGGKSSFKTFKPGDEDDLAEVLSNEEAERLVAKGYLEGNWTGKGKAKAEPARTATDSTKK